MITLSRSCKVHKKEQLLKILLCEEEEKKNQRKVKVGKTNSRCLDDVNRDARKLMIRLW